RVVARAEGSAVNRVGDGGVGIGAGNRDVRVGGAQGAVVARRPVGGVVGQLNGGLGFLGVDREGQHVAAGLVASRIGGAHLDGVRALVRAVGQRRRVVARAEGSAVNRVGDGGVGIGAGNRDVRVGGAQVAVVARRPVGGVVGQLNGGLGFLGVDREGQHVAAGLVASRIGGAHLDSVRALVRAVGQRRRVVARAEGSAVNRVGDGGVGIGAGNRDVRVGGAQVAVVARRPVGGVVGQLNGGLGFLGVDREGQHVAAGLVASRIGGAH